MARSLNRVTLIGHLGGDPEVRSTPGGIPIASFSVATSEAWKDKQTGEQKERTEWSNCEAWGGLAELCGKYLGKGSKVYVEGSLRTEEWKDKTSGEPRKATKIRVNEMLMLDGQKRDGASAPAQQKAPAPAQAEFDSGIPF